MTGSVEEYLRRSRSLEKAGRPEEAAVVLRDGIQKYPDEGSLFERLGSLLWERGEQEESIQAWREAVRLHPDLECPRLILSFHLREVGRFEEALAVLQEGVRLFPKRRTTFLREVGMLLERQGDDDDATAVYQEVLSLHPDDGVTLDRQLELRERRLRRLRQGRDEPEVHAPPEEWFWELLESSNRNLLSLGLKLEELPKGRLIQYRLQYDRAKDAVNPCSCALFRPYVSSCDLQDHGDGFASWVVAQGRAFHAEIRAHPERLQQYLKKYEGYELDWDWDDEELTRFDGPLSPDAIVYGIYRARFGEDLLNACYDELGRPR